MAADMDNNVQGERCTQSDSLRRQISDFLAFRVPETTVPFTTHELVEEPSYHRTRISYAGEEGDHIPALLWLPYGTGPFAAILIHHQHNSERHLGKSEVAGLVGDPLQAFGPALAQRGIAVLAPDSICFEDRRHNRSGTEPDGVADVEQHYNEMCYRLVRGDTLMRKVLDDSARGISVLCEHPLIDSERIGILGHSYGGNTVLFHAALDERIRFACASGAAGTYRYKLAHQYGIEMAEVIPGFAARFDIQDLVMCMAPRRVLVVSATDDAASQDADAVATTARTAWAALGTAERLEHARYPGTHPVTRERFEAIVDWLAACAGS
jgi:dienelactone hydrolase